MTIRRIRHKLLIALAIALSIGFVAIAYFYNQAVERSIIDEYQRTLKRMTDSVVMSIETIMTENHAEIMPEYANRLKVLPGLLDFRIGRIDGTEAYIDNKTIAAVNARVGQELFAPRRNIAQAGPVFAPDSATVQEVMRSRQAVYQAEHSVEHGSIVQFLQPIPSGPRCHRCHGDDTPLRGILKVTASMTEVERDMMRARLQSLVILVISLLVTMGVTGYMLGRSVADPIEAVTRAIAKISTGDYSSHLQVDRQDELGNMANSFNKMIGELRQTYLKMSNEQEKLSAVIQGTREAVVVTDAKGSVVLVNGAASELVGKSEAQICNEGITHLLDAPDRFQAMLSLPDGKVEPELFEYRDHFLLVTASTIHDDEGNVIGSAALLRDVSQERRLINELQRLSTTDALTDVYNRRHLDATLKTEMARAREISLPLSVIMCDVDHFKKFNDTYGHDQGDRVLRMVGEVMKQSVRQYDVPCRYGGEEFTIILPSTNAAGAYTVAERLRQNVETMRVDGLQVTISLGISSYPEVSAGSGEELITIADTALYRSKEDGRNRITTATSA